MFFAVIYRCFIRTYVMFFQVLIYGRSPNPNWVLDHKIKCFFVCEDDKRMNSWASCNVFIAINLNVFHAVRGITVFTPLPLGEGQGGGAACCCRCRCCSSSFFFSVLYQHFIGCATSSLATFLQYILFDKVIEVTSCGILRTVIYLVPLRGSQLPFKTIEEHVEHLSLSVV